MKPSAHFGEWVCFICWLTSCSILSGRSTHTISWRNGIGEPESVKSSTFSGKGQKEEVNDKLSENDTRRTRQMPVENLNKIDLLCSMALKVSDDDIQRMREIINDQREFIRPLMPATTEWQHQLADFNERVLDKVIELKELIASGESIVEPEEKIKLFEDDDKEDE